MKILLEFFKLKIEANLICPTGLIFYWLTLRFFGFDLINIYTLNNVKSGSIKLFGFKVMSWLNKKITFLGKKI